MKIEHIIYVLARRIINFHLFLQKICDLELLDPIPYENTSQKKINFGPRPYLWFQGPNQFGGVPWDVGSLEKPTFSWPKGPPLHENSPKEGTFQRTRNGSICSERVQLVFNPLRAHYIPRNPPKLSPVKNSPQDQRNGTGSKVEFFCDVFAYAIENWVQSSTSQIFWKNK